MTAITTKILNNHKNKIVVSPLLVIKLVSIPMFSWSRNIIKLNKFVNMSFLMVLLAHGVAAIAPNFVPIPMFSWSVNIMKLISLV